MQYKVWEILFSRKIVMYKFLITALFNKSFEENSNGKNTKDKYLVKVNFKIKIIESC